MGGVCLWSQLCAAQLCFNYALGKHLDVVSNQNGSVDQKMHSKCNHVEDN